MEEVASVTLRAEQASLGLISFPNFQARLEMPTGCLCTLSQESFKLFLVLLLIQRECGGMEDEEHWASAHWTFLPLVEW